MGTVGFYSSNDQKMFPCKPQFAKTPMNQQACLSRPFENFYQTSLLQAGGFVQQYRPPHDHFHSYPPFSPPQQKQKQQQQPPLLPLPHPHTRIRNPDSHPRVRSLSCQPTSRKNSPTPRKSKQQPLPVIPKNLKPIDKDIEDRVTKIYNSSILGANSTGIKLMKDAKDQDVPDFSGSLAPSPSPFTLSPPPSSLPLPTFSLRPKHMSCNGMAAGFDAGATDNLQRLLHLN